MTDRSLMGRLERLEAERPAARTRFVWMEKDDTQAQALSRVAPLGPRETPVFVGWNWCD
jgi:hypothetical protein